LITDCSPVRLPLVVYQVAVALNGRLALMPCCYGEPAPDMPPVLRGVVGRGLSIDIHRTYALHAAGYAVDWTAIPRRVTIKNRIILAAPKAEAEAEAEAGGGGGDGGEEVAGGGGGSGSGRLRGGPQRQQGQAQGKKPTRSQKKTARKDAEVAAAASGLG
jgi:hypothetical protein